MAKANEARIRLPARLDAMLQKAVDARFTTKADYMRQALLVQLKADGFLGDTKSS